MSEGGTNVVPLFKTFEALHEEECAIYKWFYDAWHDEFHQWDLVNAALANDEGELSKLAAGNAERAIAKRAASRLRKGCNPEFFASCELARTLHALVKKRSEQLYGLGTLARRSQRFASAHASRNYGAGAQSLPPAS